MTSLVPPARNPGPGQLGQTAARLRRFLRARTDWEAVIVFDGRTDGTLELARTFRWESLARPEFRAAVARAGFTLVQAGSLGTRL